MKIAFLTFPLSKIGGVWTYQKSLKAGFEKNGHKVTEFWLSTNKKQLGTNPYNFETLSTETNEWLEEYKKRLDDFDLAFFIHPCPHLTKSYNSRRWELAYDLPIPIIVGWHDRFWNNYYPWFIEVAHRVKLIACVQECTAISLLKVTVPKTITGHPLILDDAGLYEEEKENLVIHTSYFKSWKHPEIFLQAIPKIKAKKEVYHEGLLYHQLSGVKRDPKFFINGRWIWDVAEKSGMNYKGSVSDEKITEAYQRAKVVPNMAWYKFSGINGFPNTDYVELEAMKYGCLAIRRRNLANPLTEKNVVVVSESNIITDLAKKTNGIIKNWDNYKSMRKKNLKFLKVHYDTEVITKQLLIKVKG